MINLALKPRVAHCINQRPITLFWTGLIAMLTILPISTTSQAATITVNADLDSATGCTLIDAINSANANSSLSGCSAVTTGAFGDDTIILTGDFTYHNISSVNNFLDGPNALPSISSNITITASDALGTLVRFSAVPTRYFHITSNGELTLNNMSLLLGHASDGLVSLSNADYGGAIYNKGLLRVNKSIIRGNVAQQGGGIFNATGATAYLQQTEVRQNQGSGIENLGTLIVTDSTFKENSTENGVGGGINNRHASSATLFRTAFVDNSASFGGGAIWNAANMTIKDSTFALNKSTTFGGAVAAAGSGTTTIINATFSGNISNKGGGISHLAGTLNLINTLISGNLLSGVSASGREVHRSGGTPGRNKNNLIGHNGSDNSQAFNAPALISFSSASSNNIIATSDGDRPTPLGNIIRPKTQVNKQVYYPLAAGSPAIDAAASTFIISVLPVEGCFVPKLFPAVGFFRDDQLGNRRPEGTACDIGAYEFQETQFFAIPLKSGKTVIFGL